MDHVVRGGNWYFESLNAWRVLDEVTLPEIAFRTEDFAPGGHMMGAAFPEDLQPLKATIKLRTDDPRVRGLCGRQPGDYVSCTWYENHVSYRNGETAGRIIQIKGLLNTVKADQRKGLKASGTEYEFSTIVLYHDTVDGKSVHKFDYFAGPGATLVDGTNPFAAMAANLAISGGTAL